ncbi:MAG: endonuclease/exonuclease/phosphatase family protein [Nocardioides sp.]|nr:endonuclease/exonuclease/phosphatase family protein [Nocardioides sp.]
MGRSRWLFGLAALVALPAVALTLNRIVQPDAGWAIRLVAFTPFALPFYVVCLLLVIGVLLADPAARRRAVGVPTVVLALGLVVHASWLAPEFVGRSPDVAGETFTVMNLNLLRGNADPEQVVRLVEERGVEVLVLEEITDAAVAALERAGLSEVLPHSAGQAGSDVEGTMVFATENIEAVSQIGTGFGAWSMTVRLPQGDVQLAAVHPVAPVGDARSWRQDFGVLEASQRERPSDLMVGDFNATLDHRALRELGFDDAAAMVNHGWGPTWPDNGTTDILGVPVPRMVAIDHVLLGDRMAATEVDSASVDGTDHRAVIAEVGLR